MNILLVISGSISCYKSIDLLREYIRDEHIVKVILTNGALKFLRPELFSFLGASNVYCPNDDFNQKLSNDIPLHINLARWCDRFIVAPMSAGLLSRFVSANTSDLASSVFLAMDLQKTKCFYPAMNTKMLKHPFTQEHLIKLSKLENTFIHPSEIGILACGELGEGKLPKVEEIFITSITFNSNFHKTVLIATGATIAQIDTVRYITNPSSGLTGYYLAVEALRRGFNVCVIAGKYSTSRLENLSSLPNFKLIKVNTTEELFSQAKIEFKKCNFYITPAAISDISIDTKKIKIKKNNFSNELQLKNTPDILKYLLKNKKEHQKIVGFAAESELTKKNLIEKYNNKPVDLLVGTKVHQGSLEYEVQGFKNDSAHYEILQNKSIIFSGKLLKAELANYIFNKLTTLPESHCSH